MDFEYSTLNKDKREIRLLEVEHCADPTLPLHVYLKVADLDDEPVYIALSYTWGKEQPSYDIQLTQEADGKAATFRVRHNLHAFLRMLQSNTMIRDEGTYFWIDQICINQNDFAERTHQVQQMDRVYRQATQVHVWLSDEVERYGRLGALFQDEWASILVRRGVFTHELDILQSKPSADANDAGGETVRFEDTTEKYKSDGWMGSVAMTWGVKNLLRSVIDSVESVMKAEYWTRVWILQEISLARDCRVWLGPHKIKWSLFLEHMMSVFAIGSYTNIGLSRDIIDRGAELLLHKTARADDTLTWSDSAFVIERYACSVPVDKFYGLLSLVHPSVRVVPDYEKSPKEVLFEVVKKEVAFIQSALATVRAESESEIQKNAIGNALIAAHEYSAVLNVMAVTLRWWRQTGGVSEIDRAELRDFLRREVFGKSRDSLHQSGRPSIPGLIDEAVLWMFSPRNESALWRNTAGRLWDGVFNFQRYMNH